MSSGSNLVTNVIYSVLTAGHLSRETEAYLCELLQGTTPCFGDVDALIMLQQAIASGRVTREANAAPSLNAYPTKTATSLS
jgi:hypothetical protein